MRKRTLVLTGLAGGATLLALCALTILSIRAGIAPVTIPIAALVLGPALAATALVATCSMVAPPLRPQPVRRTIDIRSSARDDAVERPA